MSNARAKDYDLLARLDSAGIDAEVDQASVLRRAQMTLHRWAELECGDGDDRASWAIERDEETGKPYRCVYWHSGDMRRYPTPDREAGALRRIKALCDELGIFYYHQTDPRGCALYVGAEPLDSQTYSSKGVACV